MARRTYSFGRFLLDPVERLLVRDGVRVPLTPKAFDLLCVLVESQGRLVTKEDLIRTLWPDSFVEEGGLTRCVSVVRKALGDGNGGRDYIETVPKQGYRFVAPVVESGGDSIEPTESAEPSKALPRWTWLALAGAGLVAALVVIHAWANPASGGVAVPARPSAPLEFAGQRPSTASTTGHEAGSPAVPQVALLEVAAPTPLLPDSATPAHRQATFGEGEGSPALSPDGRRLAYVSLTSSKRQVVIQDLAGGPPRTVFEAPEADWLRWSPDGSELMFWTRGGDFEGLVLVPRIGGPTKRVAAGAGVGAFSPDGSTVAIGVALAGRIDFHARRDGGRRSISLSNVHRWIFDIDWSATTNLLSVVTNDEEGRYTIWTVRPDGTEQTAVVVDDKEILAARWSPQGDAIYYTRRVGQTTSIQRVDARQVSPGRRAVPVVVMSGLEMDGAFSLSSDGRRMAYSRAPLHSNLWVVDMQRSVESGRLDAKPLTQGTRVVERPRVSPDGQEVLFNIGPAGLTNLYTVPITGGSPKQLTFLDGFNLGGAWSPDGRSVAFASTQDGRPRVWRVNVSGGRPEALSVGELSDTYDLSWSPGREILYQQAGNHNYYALDPVSSRERLLVTEQSVGWMFFPSYSPDAKRIAVAWSRMPAVGVWLLDSSGQPERLLLKQSMAQVLGWAPDGESLYAFDGKRAAYRGVAVPSGETTTEAQILKITLDGTARPFLTLPFGEVGGVALSPDGRHLVCTVYTTSSSVWLADDFDAIGH